MSYKMKKRTAASFLDDPKQNIKEEYDYHFTDYSVLTRKNKVNADTYSQVESRTFHWMRFSLTLELARPKLIVIFLKDPVTFFFFL